MPLIAAIHRGRTTYGVCTVQRQAQRLKPTRGNRIHIQNVSVVFEGHMRPYYRAIGIVCLFRKPCVKALGPTAMDVPWNSRWEFSWKSHRSPSGSHENSMNPRQHATGRLITPTYFQGSPLVEPYTNSKSYVPHPSTGSILSKLKVQTDDQTYGLGSQTNKSEK